MTDANKAYEAIELAKKTGKIKKGINEVTKTIERGSAKLVVLASDVSPAEIILHLKPLCEEKGIPCIEVPSKEELGGAAGLGVSTTAVSIEKEGDSRDFIKSLGKPKKEAPKEEPKAEEKPAEEKPAEKPKEVKDETPKSEPKEKQETK